MYIACGLLSCVLTLQAQTKDGGIDAQMLQQIQKSGLTKSDRALSNAIATNSIDDLARNFRNSGPVDTETEYPRSEKFWSLLALYRTECAAC